MLNLFSPDVYVSCVEVVCTFTEVVCIFEVGRPCYFSAINMCPPLFISHLVHVLEFIHLESRASAYGKSFAKSLSCNCKSSSAIQFWRFSLSLSLLRVSCLQCMLYISATTMTSYSLTKSIIM